MKRYVFLFTDSSNLVFTFMYANKFLISINIDLNSFFKFQFRFLNLGALSLGQKIPHMLYSSLLLSHRISPYPKFSRQNLCLASICIWRNYISTILCFYNCRLGPYSMTSSGANTSTLGCSFLILKEGCCSLTTWRP